MSVEVKQQDRDRAADLMEDQKPLWHDGIQDIRDGNNDSSPIVQAFAAHRHQAEEAMRERAAKEADKSMRRHRRYISNGRKAGLSDSATHNDHVMALEARDIARAIRSIDTRGE